VDGVDEEWRDLVLPVKGQHFSLAFANDEDSLYFCLITKDENTIRQIWRVGLILWLDPAGGKKKSFGIRFPADEGPRTTSRPRTAARERAEGRAQSEAQQQPAILAGDIEVLGRGGRDARRVENGKSGIAARYSMRPDLLIYELEVPLRKSDRAPFSLDVDPGAALRVELQTPEWRGPIPMRRNGPRIGIGVGGGAGGGVVYPGADMALLKPLDIAATLRLAVAPAR
jgi:hypothetical protein